MSKHLRLLFFLFSAPFLTKTAVAQSISRDVDCASGETLVNGDISLTFVLGEAVGELFSNPESSKYLTVGFVQPDVEIKEILDRDISKSLVVYPNPTRNGLVKLAFNNIPEASYSIEIIDELGRTLQTKTVTFRKDDFLYVDLDVSSYAKGMYFIRVKNSINFQGQVKLIKI